MQATILNGKEFSKSFHSFIKTKVESNEDNYRKPGLGVILVGENPASQTYVNTKERIATKSCGFNTFNKKLNKDSSFEAVKSAIEEFNNNDEIDGILLQLPLPDHLDSESLLDLIDPKKDVDGLHPINQGLLQKGRAELIPCTPLGSLKLIDLSFYLKELNSDFNLEAIDVSKIPEKDLSRKNAVVIGRSLLVGKPMATLLLDRNATVTIVHSRTENIEEVCAKADILVAAVGRESIVKSSWVKKGAIVIDVGINRNEAGKLCGDVDYSDVVEKASAITPVPGGVGPMTVAMLMLNTLNAYLKNIEK